jgi:hypothetical protein
MAERVRYRRPKRSCAPCRRTFQPRASAVLPQSRYGHQLSATTTTIHDRHGIPRGRVCDQTGLGPGSLVELFHRLARLLAGIPDQLVVEDRQAPVKHADETGWRTHGTTGDAWRYSTPSPGAMPPAAGGQRAPTRLRQDLAAWLSGG